MSDINNGGFSARAKIVTDDKSPGGSFSTSAKVISSANNIAGDLLTVAQGKANYSGNGVNLSFFTGLDITSATKISVYVNGVYQYSGTYSFLNGVLTFTEAPPIGVDNIEVQYIYGVETIEADAEGSITSTSFNSKFLSGDDSTTLFDMGVTLINEYKCIVFIDGIFQDKNVYEVSGTNIIFSEAPPEGTDNIEVVYLFNYTADREEIASGGYVEAAQAAAETAITNADTSTVNATNAATSEANAATSEANSLQYYTEFFSIYLGQKALDPSVDNDGNALENGMMYYNTTEDKLKIWNGVNWLYTGSSNIASVKSVGFVGTGSEVDFDTPESYGDGSQLLVYVSGVYQDQTSYSYSAPTITFNEAPPVNSDIQVVYVHTYDSEATQAVLTALVTEAEGYRDEALISKNSAEASATTATTKASEASTSASEALASSQAAAISETNAATSETNAATSETNAAASEGSVATNAANAATSEANALASANNAATSESNASASETSASQSAAIATTKASEALTSASNALASEQAASVSESNSVASEQAASISEGNAATSETNAAQSAIGASTSASEALSYKNDAELALDQFTDLYLGAKASGPTLDNDGDALQVGALYFNTSSNNLNFYNGSIWTPIEFQDIEPVRAESVAFAIALG